MSATQEIAEPKGARVIQARADRSADLRNDPTAAVAAAERACAAAETDKRGAARVKAVERHQREMSLLLEVQINVSAPGLHRLITQGAALKQEAFDLGLIHSAAS